MNTTLVPASISNNSVNEELLNLFHRHGELKERSPGAELFRQNHSISDACLIERGLVKLMHTNQQGREVIIALRWPIRMLGVMAIISTRPAPTSAVTLTSCLMRCISTDSFLGLLQTDSEFSNCILRAISQDFYEQTLNQVQLSTANSRERLSRFLLQLIPVSAQEQEGELRLQLPIPKGDLAKLLAITPEHLSRVLAELEKRGAIRRSKGWIYVTSIALLSHEAS